MMESKLLKKIGVIQEVDNVGRKLGRGFLTARRLNPYNPLSYIGLIIAVILFIPIVVIIAIYESVIKFRNPFKWD